jgi:hypothetical protein
MERPEDRVVACGCAGRNEGERRQDRNGDNCDKNISHHYVISIFRLIEGPRFAPRDHTQATLERWRRRGLGLKRTATGPNANSARNFVEIFVKQASSMSRLSGIGSSAARSSGRSVLHLMRCGAGERVRGSARLEPDYAIARPCSGTQSFAANPVRDRRSTHIHSLRPYCACVVQDRDFVSTQRPPRLSCASNLLRSGMMGYFD